MENVPARDAAAEDALAHLHLFPRVKEWVNTHLPHCTRQLASLRDHPEAFWISRAKRMTATFTGALATADAQAADLAAWHKAHPERGDIAAAVRDMDALRATLGQIIAQTRHIARTGRSLKTVMAQPIPLHQLPRLLAELHAAAFEHDHRLTVINAITRNATGNAADIETLAHQNADSREVLDLSASHLAHWRKGTLTHRQREQIGEAQRLISAHRVLLNTMDTFIDRARLLLQRGRPAA